MRRMVQALDTFPRRPIFNSYVGFMLALAVMAVVLLAMVWALAPERPTKPVCPPGSSIVVAPDGYGRCGS